MTAPILLPLGMDALLAARREADAMVEHALVSRKYIVAMREADYARRLDAIAAQRGQE